MARREAIVIGDQESAEPLRDGHHHHVERLSLMHEAREVVAGTYVGFDLWLTPSDAVNHLRGNAEQLLKIADRIEELCRRKVR